MSVIQDALQTPGLIAYVSGASNYSFIHFRNGQQILISRSLRSLEACLPTFIRVHKTLLVNPGCITDLIRPRYRKGSGEIVMEGGLVLPVSRRRWPLFAREHEEL